jgi:hypothetical protein
MQLSDVAFLAADTARSRAYCQALLNANLELASVLIVTSPGGRKPGQHTGAVSRARSIALKSSNGSRRHPRDWSYSPDSAVRSSGEMF